MLSTKRRSAAARALFTGYCRYRHHGIYTVATGRDLQIVSIPGIVLAGSITSADKLATMRRHGASTSLRKVVYIPAAGPDVCREFVFWHELAHDLLHVAGAQSDSNLPTLKGQEYHPDDWEWEWWCDKFAYLMVMYQAGIELLPSLSTGYRAFFEADPHRLREMQEKSTRQPLNLLIRSQIAEHLEKYKDKLDHEKEFGILMLMSATVEHS